MPSDPLSLGFDTSAAHCAAALLRGDTILAQVEEPMNKGQAERLFPLLEEVLQQGGAGWPDLDVIGVGTGPGNFTGIRIAIAAARGLALSLNIPAVGVPCPEALALGLPRPCRILIPGRRDEAIWQDFSADGPVAPAAQTPATGLPPGPPVVSPQTPLAVAIAHIAVNRRETPGPRPAPIYLRPADAAPARDAGPVML